MKKIRNVKKVCTIISFGGEHIERKYFDDVVKAYYYAKNVKTIDKTTKLMQFVEGYEFENWKGERFNFTPKKPNKDTIWLTGGLEFFYEEFVKPEEDARMKREIESGEAMCIHIE